jgi:hypothetical protein
VCRLSQTGLIPAPMHKPHIDHNPKRLNTTIERIEQSLNMSAPARSRLSLARGEGEGWVKFTCKINGLWRVRGRKKFCEGGNSWAQQRSGVSALEFRKQNCTPKSCILLGCARSERC